LGLRYFLSYTTFCLLSFSFLFLSFPFFSFLFLSLQMCSIFSDLRSVYVTWPALSSYLTSEEGGSLRIDDYSTHENPFALVRYVKGKSNMSLKHVRAFRSVIWDTMENCPVSVTSFKSNDGENLPTGSVENFHIEPFLDGVMIGLFYDKHNARWRIHTRSTLDANCRYYSQNKTFNQMFAEAFHPSIYDTLDKSASYTYILQHAENRIVVPVNGPPRALCVDKAMFEAGIVRFVGSTAPCVISWDAVRSTLADLNIRFGYRVQGMVVKNNVTGERYKVRTPVYNHVRRVRGNSARRDFLWLGAWQAGTIRDYLALFPEERAESDAIINRWKQVTNAVYHIYTDVFKARSLNKTAIPPKYRPLVYGLHSMYLDTLKPANKTVDWRTALEYMNGRDTAQMLFVINWEARQAARQLGVPSIPLEPPTSVGTEVVAAEEPVVAIVDSTNVVAMTVAVTSDALSV
jgi:hypothetical protein